MSHPPLDPPPFQPATVRQCIKNAVKIQNIDTDEPQEVLILTPVNNSVESILSVDADATTQIDYMEDFGEEEGEISVEGMHGVEADASTQNGSEVESDGGEGKSFCDSILSSNCSMSSDNDDDEERNERHENAPMKAFLKSQRPLRENQHGPYTTYIYYARVLQKSDPDWILTDEEVIIKEVSWETIRQSRSRLSEDFLKEIAALQYVSDWHSSEMDGRSMLDTHVLPADAIMSNRSHLYIVMPFCRGGDLFQLVAEREERRLTEDESRFWFRQILRGLESLQLMQLCHKDLSPENFILLDNTSLVIDFGMCLRIPYSPEGRRMITPKTACGKLPFVAPEILKGCPFDGHAVDIWAAGTILLFLLTGVRLPNPLLAERILQSYDLGVSYEALDLLRAMLRLDPSRRLSFEQIQNHRWVQQEFM